MTTEAGKRLLAEAHDAAWNAPGPWWHMSENRMGSYIAAVEAEAVAGDRAALRAQVEGLPLTQEISFVLAAIDAAMPGERR